MPVVAEPPRELVRCVLIAGEVGEKQWGIVTAKQLRKRKVRWPEIQAAISRKRLFVVYPGVYSLIPPEYLNVFARHAAAILAGGRDSALCDESATWWLKLTRSMPPLIHVAVRNTLKPIEGIQWHELTLRQGERIKHHRMPVTSPARTALDYAATHSLWDTKGVLAELEYHFKIEAQDLLPTLRRGHPGSKLLRKAIDDHTPQLAHTHSEAERLFLRFLTEQRLERPNAQVEYGPTHVDFAYAHLNLIVEVDGVRAHGSERRIANDHRRDLHRRRDGKRTLRYHVDQIATEPILLRADLLAHGVAEVAANRRSRQSKK